MKQLIISIGGKNTSEMDSKPNYLSNKPNYFKSWLKQACTLSAPILL
jgi:hypothetical protein